MGPRTTSTRLLFDEDKETLAPGSASEPSAVGERKKLPARKGRVAAAEEKRPAPPPVSLWADVAVDRPVRCEFTYGVPDELRATCRPGVRVAVSLGMRREVGVVVALRSEPGIDEKKIKPIDRVLDAEPLIDPGLLELTRWMASYYVCSWGEALAAVLPAALKREKERRRIVTITAAKGRGEEALREIEKRSPKQHRLLRTLQEIGGPIELRDVCRRLQIGESVADGLVRKGLVRIERREAAVDPFLSAPSERARPEKLSQEQQAALDAIVPVIREGAYATFLLHGVTGSGKTEVYLRAIEGAIALGKGAIVIVPEIALTPQTVGWFRSRFGQVAVLHSRMTEAQRCEMWLKVKHGEARVVVGARSAVFAPIADLGVIVVDEEHEPSYKQDGAPRYHGRDVAVMRARNHGAVCILGSATPSLETWQNARIGRYRLLRLRTRVGGGRMPKIEIVDLRQEKAPGQGPVLFSRRLETLLRSAFERKEQSILFLNRRGFAPVLWCAACGETARCGICDVSLTWHRRIRRAVCHACCQETVPPAACPSCTAPAMRYLGAGSERVEAALADLLPGARVRRMDSDTMVRREDYEDVLERFGRGEIDVLVGTQMIAKGLDFPRVTVVGIVSADSALHLPDFRAAERTFQLLSQVSGRAGRGELPGEIVVQTMAPSHPAILSAARHDYEGFAAEESRLRKELGYPPHGRLVRVVFEDKDETRVVAAARECAEMLRGIGATDRRSDDEPRAGIDADPGRAGIDARSRGAGIDIKPDGEKGWMVLGPAEAPIALLRGRIRHHLLIKVPLGDRGFESLRSRLIEFVAERLRPRITIDVDPASML